MNIDSTGFTVLNGDESSASLGCRDSICLCDSGLLSIIHILLLSGPEVPYSICHIPGTISRVCIGSPNIDTVGAAVMSSIHGMLTAGTFNSSATFIISSSLKLPAE